MKINTPLLFLCALLVLPLTSFAQVTELHKVDRITSSAQGVTFLRTASGERWTAAGEECESSFMRFSRADFKDDESGDAYENIYAQVLLAVGTGREMRFLEISCTASTASIRFGRIETREPQ